MAETTSYAYSFFPLSRPVHENYLMSGANALDYALSLASKQAK